MWEKTLEMRESCSPDESQAWSGGLIVQAGHQCRGLLCTRYGAVCLGLVVTQIATRIIYI